MTEHLGVEGVPFPVSAEETVTVAILEASEVGTGKRSTLIAGYAVRCDGASSRVTKALGVPLVSGSVYVFTSNTFRGTARNEIG